MIRRAASFAAKMAVGTLAILATAVLIGLVVSWLSTPRSGAQSVPRDHGAAVGVSADVAEPQSGAPKDSAPDATFGTIGLVVGGRELGDGPTLQRTPLGAPFSALDQEAGDTKADGAGATDSPVSGLASSADLDLADYALPTTLAGFGGLHPIAESWYRGVAAGKASHMGAGFGPAYLALPIGPGFRVEIVGAGGKVTRVSTDAGPDLAMQRKGRVADLNVWDFLAVCGVPLSMGLCQVSVTVLGRVRAE